MGSSLICGFDSQEENTLQDESYDRSYNAYSVQEESARKII